MNYGESNENFNETGDIVVDLRSDTFTKPSKAMRQAMGDAEVGDAVFNEDPTVNELQDKVAKLLGKEAAIYLPSGTMSNLVAILTHCDVRGCEAYCGEQAHIVHHEQGGAAQVGGVLLRTIPNKLDGSFDLKILESKFRNDSVHEPISRLIAVENTIGGRIVPQSWIKELAVLAKKYNLKLHLDGARIWNVSVATNIPLEELAAPFDSVSCCLSKGLGAPVGSLLCGSKEFIQKAKRAQKVLGGGMRQAGVLAAAGLVALDETLPLLKQDHERAYSIAKAIDSINSKTFTVNLSEVQTNMIFVSINSDKYDGICFAERLAAKDDTCAEGRVIVKSLALSSKMIRLVVNRDHTTPMIQAAIDKIMHVIREISKE
ncbi:L-allo-threonine aldolase [Prorops nasuta]|uniref:L-allo-threonine aldolase n=1 Tax=Prorops nasuta TaxID=863751 RepID=UPI0034CE1CBE